MALFSTNHPREGVFGFMNACLQQLEQDPERLDMERARYDEPPPPYASSGEITQPASPVQEASVDAEDALLARRKLMFQSWPRHQFERQWHREKERLEYQLQKERFGRRQTLPYDETADLLANAENNVRARWVEQGIWREDWGPAWPKGANPSDSNWRCTKQNTGGPYVGNRWIHEKRPDHKALSPSPEPAPQPNSVSEPVDYFAASLINRPEREESPITAEKSGSASAPDVTAERDTSASRPYQQFIFQVSKEREWVRDKLLFKRPPGPIDINAMAYESTKSNWIEDGTWNPKWGEFPGATWLHEDLEDEDEDEDENEEERQTSEPHPNIDNTTEQPPRLPTFKFLDPQPTPGVSNDSSNSNNMSTVPEEVDAPTEVTTRPRAKRKSTRGASRISAGGESPRSAEESAGRVLRSVRSSRVVKPRKSSRQGPGQVVSSGSEQPPNKRPVRTTRRTSLGTRGSEASKSKGKIEHQRSPNSRTKKAIVQSPPADLPNITRKRRPTARDQPIATQGLRRSKRIAAQMQNTPTVSERKTAASGKSKEPSRSTSTSADTRQSKKQQHRSSGGTRAELCPGTKR